MLFLRTLWENHHDGVLFGLTLTGLLAAVLIGHAVLFKLFRRVSENARKYFLVRTLRKPFLCTALLVVLLMVFPAAPLPHEVLAAVERLLDLSLIGCTAWVLVSLLENAEETLSSQYRIDIADNLLARRIRTRLQVFHHITMGAIMFITLAVALMTFPNVRSLGASLLASAGLAGLVAGMAARPALTNLFAGLQIALTEPIRLEDVVIVEGEWGWIEDIYATYVVVRIWDLRRMILPLSYFIEHPFQNWTRRSSEILGTVFLHTDYRVPVEAIRQEFQNILKSTPLWQGKVSGLQVSDSTEHTIELRALMDASDSGKAWDLRCYVREKLLGFLQTHYPESLPRTRVDISGELKTKPAP